MPVADSRGTAAATAAAAPALSVGGRAIAGGVRILAAAALTSAILLVAPHSWQPAALDGPVGEGGWTARTRAWFVASGFYPAEVDTATEHQFSWTEETFRITIPHLHRSRPHRLAIDVSAGRPSGEAPELLVTVDGVAGAPERVGNERRRLDIVIPSRTSEGVTIAFRVSSTFVPGPDDPRTLGLLVHAVGLSDSPGPSWAVIARTALAVALCVAGVLLCGLGSRALEWFVALAMAASAAWLMLADGAFLGILANRLVPIGVGTFAVGVSTALLRARWPVVLGLPEWSAAVGLVLSTSAVKLAFFAHPMITVGDGIFQVHRAQLVHQGHYFFTSVTPSPSFEIPYPVGLYVAALPFWDFFPSKLDPLRLLRTVAVVVDALVGLGLYAVARRQWNDPRAALLAAGLWPFARAPVWGLCNANLTNVFGQALFGLGMGVLAWIAASPGMAIGAAIGGGALLVAAYLSHFGTGARRRAAGLSRRRRPAGRRPGTRPARRAVDSAHRIRRTRGVVPGLLLALHRDLPAHGLARRRGARGWADQAGRPSRHQAATLAGRDLRRLRPARPAPVCRRGDRRLDAGATAAA